MLHKITHRFANLRPKSSEPIDIEGTIDKDITAEDIYRYRQQSGVNLGSWFVLERWITDEPFQLAKQPAQSDLDVAHGPNAKYLLEKHLDEWITEEDWRWISQRGINSVRIPIGYYHLCGVDYRVLEGTDFQPFYNTFSGAWARITKAIQAASRYGIGVLIDLHAAPGKQNNDAHAGTSDRANFFGDPHNQRCTIRALRIMVEHLTSFVKSHNPPLVNLIGIELLNEPAPPTDQALQSWYTSAISSIRELNPTLPIYIGDCWRTDSYADYISKHPALALTVLDHHLYRCFTDVDIHTSAEEHSRALGDSSGQISRTLANASEKLGRAGGGIVVGEWSGALNPGSLRGSPHEQKHFVDAQLRLFDSHCAGWYFWTFKKQYTGDSGWSLKDAVGAGVFPDFVGVRLRPIDGTMGVEVRDKITAKFLHEHTQYWSQYPGSYDHRQFEDGFMVGWNDMYQFALSTPPNSTTLSRIGFKGAWARRRTVNHGKSYWEFEHGFMQGVSAAEDNMKG